MIKILKQKKTLSIAKQVFIVLSLLAIVIMPIQAAVGNADSGDSIHVWNESYTWHTDSQSTTGPHPPTGLAGGVSSQMLDYQVVISDLPAYTWYRGCGPTAAGMIIGYWDGHGFDDLVSGNASTQTSAVNDMISSSGNYDDYCLPIDYYPTLLPDKSEPPFGDEHLDNCVADFMETSQSYYYNYYGWSWYSAVDDALREYVLMGAPHYKVNARNDHWGAFTWDSFRYEIDTNHPVVLLVDTDGNGGTDHFITAIGYGEQGGTPMYACLNTWDTSIHWYEFARMVSGQPWGIYGATIFGLEKSGTPEFASIVISPDFVGGMEVGQTQQFTATAKDQFGNEITDIIFTWTSSNTTVGAINDTGYFTALAAGTTTINATSGSIVGSAYVTVNPSAGIPGDINGDDVVDYKDGPYLVKHVLGIPGYETIHANGDVNCDSKVDYKDGPFLVKHVLGIPGYEHIC